MSASPSRRLPAERIRYAALEPGDELLALVEDDAVRDRTAADSALDALDEDAVLASDLVVEGQELLDPRVVDVRREEVIEEPARALGPGRDERPDRQVRPAGVR